MQHSLFRLRSEPVKLFVKKNPATVVLDLQVYKFDGTVITDITPTYSIENIREGYYTTEITTPNDDCYVLVKFCGSPIVIRVGKPDLQFIYYNKPSLTLPYQHYEDEGTLVGSGELTELNHGFYFYTPVNDQLGDDISLGFVEVYGKPYPLALPFCERDVGVAIDINWTKKVIKKNFVILTEKKQFRTIVTKQNINIIRNKKTFKTKVSKQKFGTKVIKKNFKIKICR